MELSALGVAAGEDHACARLSDKSVRCWGANDREQLGNGDDDFNDSGTPVPVLDLQRAPLHELADDNDGAGRAATRRE